MNQLTNIVKKTEKITPDPRPNYTGGNTSSTPGEMVVMPDMLLNVLNLDGFIQTLEIVPTYTPTRFIDQFVMVLNGGSTRAYIYDTRGRAWRYTTLT